MQINQISPLPQVFQIKLKQNMSACLVSFNLIKHSITGRSYRTLCAAQLSVRGVTMEIIHVWALASALGLATLAATLKAVEYRHELKLSNDVVSVLRQELDTLKNHHDQCVSDLEKLKTAKKDGFLKPFNTDSSHVV